LPNAGARDTSQKAGIMIPSRTNPRAKAEVLAIIADAHPELSPDHPHSVRETDDKAGEWANITEFCAALDLYLRRERRTNAKR
jgi:hypothetical protein